MVAKLALRDDLIGHKAMSTPAPVADVAADQRQILRDLAAEYGRQLRQILQVGELIKGSVYQIETRCGNPGCHCATPRRSEEHTSELQSRLHLVCRLLLEKKKKLEIQLTSLIRKLHSKSMIWAMP